MTKQKKRPGIPAAVYLVVLAVSSAVAVIIRFRQLADGTNFDTGYYSGPTIYNTIFYAVIIGLLILMILLSVTDRNRYLVDMSESSTVAVRLVTLFAGVFSLCSCCTMLYRDFFVYSAISGTDLLTVLACFLALCGFLYMFWRVKKKNAGVSDILLCLPCIWSCMLLLSMFLKHMVVMTITENIINILFVSSLCVFLLNVAKIMSGISRISSGRWLIVSGAFAVITGVCLTLPAFFLKLVTGSEYTSENVFDVTPMYFAVLLFVIVFYVYYLVTRKKCTSEDKSKEKQ